MSDLIEAVELEHMADWRIKRFGEKPAERQHQSAAALLQRLADEVRALRGGPVHSEYQAILNWLGEFDVTEDFAEQAHDYRMQIGIDQFPEDGEAYLRKLIDLARDTAGA